MPTRQLRKRRCSEPTAFAANPFIVFSTVATESGTIEFVWQGDNWFSVTQSARIVVE